MTFIKVSSLTCLNLLVIYALMTMKIQSLCITSTTKSIFYTSTPMNINLETSTPFILVETTQVPDITVSQTQPILKQILPTQEPLKVVKCILNFKKSNIIGTSISNLPTFEISISSVNTIVLYTTNFLNAIQFNMKNNQVLVYGVVNKNVKATQIDLANKQITAMNIRSDSVINSVQFLIYNLLTKRYQWTFEIGNSLNGTISSVDLPTYAPTAASFQITSISGSYNSQAILSMIIGYSFKACSPNVAIPTLPSLPSNSNLTTLPVSRPLIQTSTFLVSYLP